MLLLLRQSSPDCHHCSKLTGCSGNARREEDSEWAGESISTRASIVTTDAGDGHTMAGNRLANTGRTGMESESDVR